MTDPLAFLCFSSHPSTTTPYHHHVMKQVPRGQRGVTRNKGSPGHHNNSLPKDKEEESGGGGHMVGLDSPPYSVGLSTVDHLGYWRELQDTLFSEPT